MKPGIGTHKLTVDLPVSVYNRYVDLFAELLGEFHQLKRIEFAEFVIEYGLSYDRVKAALLERGTAM